MGRDQLLQRLRDSEACADEEFADILQTRNDDPGLNSKLTFDPDSGQRLRVCISIQGRNHHGSVAGAGEWPYRNGCGF